MEKQVISNSVNVNEKTVESVQDNLNKTSIFLTKFIFANNFDALKKSGFVNSYTKDPEIMNIITLAENQRLLFLLFKNKKMGANNLKKIVSELATIPVQIVFSYELVNDYSMIVIDFPERYTIDYDSIVQGKYSKLSLEFKQGFPATRDVRNTSGERVGAEYTIYYHIFNKTDWLREFWEKRLNLMELDPKLELWDVPDERDLIFNVKNILTK